MVMINFPSSLPIQAKSPAQQKTSLSHQDSPTALDKTGSQDLFFGMNSTFQKLEKDIRKLKQQEEIEEQKQNRRSASYIVASGLVLASPPTSPIVASFSESEGERNTRKRETDYQKNLAEIFKKHGILDGELNPDNREQVKIVGKTFTKIITQGLKPSLFSKSCDDKTTIILLNILEHPTVLHRLSKGDLTNIQMREIQDALQNSKNSYLISMLNSANHPLALSPNDNFSVIYPKS
jgi:hypothetical protein